MPRGRCHCGRVEIGAAEIAPVGVHCYCTICRTIVGGAFSSAVLVPRAAFTVGRGRDALSAYASSPNTLRHHCSTCHSPIYVEVTDLPDLGIFVAPTLFEEEAVAHVRFEHMFVRSCVRWHRIADDAVQHSEHPPPATLGLTDPPRRVPRGHEDA